MGTYTPKMEKQRVKSMEKEMQTRASLAELMVGSEFRVEGLGCQRSKACRSC